MNDDSHIHYGKSSTSFVGPDAVEFYAACVVAQALRFYAKTGIRVNRAYTPTAMLAKATSVTGKKYKRGEYVKAADDLTVWAQTMKAALPTTEDPHA